jgi:uncharacterized membrane protein
VENTSAPESGQQVRLYSASLGAVCLLAGLLAPRTPAVEPAAGQARPAARYAIVALGPSDTESEHLVINDQGQIAGNVLDDRRRPHACLFKEEKLLRLPELGASMSEVSAINNPGDVVGVVESEGGIGTVDDEHGHARPVLWREGHATNLTPSGWLGGLTRDINDRGEVICTLWDRRNNGGDFILRHGRVARIRVQKGLVLVLANAINNHGVNAGRAAPRGADTLKPTVCVCLIRNGRAVCYGPRRDAYCGNEPARLNDENMVVGNSSAVEAVTAYTIIHGKYEELDRDFFCDVSAVNDHGQYVGTHCVGNVIQDGPYRAILWQDGRRYDLNKLIPPGTGWELMHATGINNRGVIVGTATYHDHMRAFKLTPLRFTRAGDAPRWSAARESSARRLRRERR